MYSFISSPHVIDVKIQKISSFFPASSPTVRVTIIIILIIITHMTTTSTAAGLHARFFSPSSSSLRRRARCVAFGAREQKKKKKKNGKQNHRRGRSGVLACSAELLGDREDKSLWDELMEAPDFEREEEDDDVTFGGGSAAAASGEQPLWEMLADEEEEEEEEEEMENATSGEKGGGDEESARTPQQAKKKVAVRKTKKKSSVGGAAKKSAKNEAMISNSSTPKVATTKALRASSSSSQKKREEEEEEISAEDAAAELFRDTTRDALRISKSDFTVSSIIDKINRGKVDLRPSYQREYVWTVRTASKLIESLLLNIPVPTMFFHEVKSGKLEVVDGKQRLTSIWSFVQNEFPGGQAFKLSGLEVYHELNGKTFDELNETFQEIILDYPLNVHTISKTSQPDFVFEVFERLNMGATQLNEQELRNCIYQGAYTDLLEELTLNESFLFANRSKMPHLRMRDRELILRFFTMQRTTPSGFYLPAKSWLNEEMRENKDLLPKEAAEMTELFEKTLKLSVDIFGDCAFRPAKYPEASKKGQKVTAEDVSGIFVREYFESGEISVALWDTITSSFAKMVQDENETKLALEIKDEIVAAWINLARSDTFRRNMVSQPKAVLARDEMFRDMLLSLGLLSPNEDEDNE